MTNTILIVIAAALVIIAGLIAYAVVESHMAERRWKKSLGKPAPLPAADFPSDDTARQMAALYAEHLFWRSCQMADGPLPWDLIHDDYSLDGLIAHMGEVYKPARVNLIMSNDRENQALRLEIEEFCRVHYEAEQSRDAKARGKVEALLVPPASYSVN